MTMHGAHDPIISSPHHPNPFRCAPPLQVGDQLAVEKVTKQLATVRQYQRGDVVVFNPTQVRRGKKNSELVYFGLVVVASICFVSTLCQQ